MKKIILMFGLLIFSVCNAGQIIISWHMPMVNIHCKSTITEASTTNSKITVQPIEEGGFSTDRIVLNIAEDTTNEDIINTNVSITLSFMAIDADHPCPPQQPAPSPRTITLDLREMSNTILKNSGTDYAKVSPDDLSPITQSSDVFGLMLNLENWWGMYIEHAHQLAGVECDEDARVNGKLVVASESSTRLFP